MKLKAKDFALRVKAELEERLVASDPPMLSSSLRDVNLERIEIEGSGANVDLVVYFRHGARPGCVFAARWKDIAREAADDARAQEQMTGKPPSDHDLVEWFAKLILIHLDEEIEAVDLRVARGLRSCRHHMDRRSKPWAAMIASPVRRLRQVSTNSLRGLKRVYP